VYRTIRLRTKFLLSLLAVTAGLTAATLYVVSYGFEMRVWESFRGELHSSVKIYETFARERESSLVRSAQMLANLPNLRALMTTEDAATIQDESASIWRMSGGDLLVLAYRSGEIAGLQASGTDFGRAQAQESLQASIQNGESRNWWFGGEHLYELWVQQQNVRGILAVGHEINENRARDFSRVVLSEVIFRSGESVVTTTLPGMEDSRSTVPASLHVAIEGDLPGEFDYRNARYLATTVKTILYDQGDPQRDWPRAGDRLRNYQTERQVHLYDVQNLPATLDKRCAATRRDSEGKAACRWE
jgi:hypothetical protein